jgi:transposase
MSTDAHSLPNDVAALKALLLAERKELRRVVTQHQQVVTQHQRFVAQNETVLAEYDQTIQSQQRTIEQQAQQIARLLRRQYGPKQERIDPDQLLLFTSEELEELAAELSQPEETEEEEERSSPRRKRKGHGRRKLPADLPREQKIYELSAEERTCPCCGHERQEIGSESSEQLEVVPAQVKIIEHVRKKYACRHCQEQVAIAAKPPQPIEKGLPGPGLLAHTVLAKYGDHLPLYRQEDILARHGVLIRRSTLCDWMASAAELARPVWQLMRQRLLRSHVIHTDDTLVKMLAPGQTQNCRFWAYVGDPDHPYSVYDFTTDRSRDGPAKFLSGFSGYLQADAYGGYDGIYTSGPVIEVACLAHCRRYWWEARTTDPRRAHVALSYIGRLYELEEVYREAHVTGDELRAARQAQAVPILDELERWLDEEHPRVLPKSVIGKAFTYTRNQWAALRRYTQDGALAIDNNVSERTVKIAAIGRKNWLFVGSQTGGERAAILFSLVASAKANQVEPQAYLSSLFASLAERRHMSDQELENLLPNRWLATHPQHRWHIDTLRAAERKRSREARIATRRRRKK